MTLPYLEQVRHTAERTIADCDHLLGAAAMRDQMKLFEVPAVRTIHFPVAVFMEVERKERLV